MDGLIDTKEARQVTWHSYVAVPPAVSSAPPRWCGVRPPLSGAALQTPEFLSAGPALSMPAADKVTSGGEICGGE